MRKLVLIRACEDIQETQDLLERQGFSVRPLILEETVFLRILQDQCAIFDIFPAKSCDLNPSPLRCKSLIATSRNAVRSLKNAPFFNRILQKQPAFFSVGQATSACADQAGFSRIFTANASAQDLTRLIKNNRTLAPFLYVRGQNISFDIKNELAQNHIPCEEIITYARVPIYLDFQAFYACLADPDNRGFLFFSSASARIFLQHVTKCFQKGELSKKNLASLLRDRYFFCISPGVKSLFEDISENVFSSPYPTFDSFMEMLHDVTGCIRKRR